MNIPFMDPENTCESVINKLLKRYSALLELPLDLLVLVSPRSHTFTALPDLSNINFSDLSLPLNPVLPGLSLNLMSTGPSLNPTLFSEPIDINSSFDFLLLPSNFRSDHHLIENDNVNNGIMTDTNSEKCKNSVIFLSPPVRTALSNFSSNHQPSDLIVNNNVDNRIMTDTDSEKSKNSVDFLSSLANFNSDHQPSDLIENDNVDNEIITDTDSEDSENQLNTTKLIIKDLIDTTLQNKLCFII
ncbi:27838_t:CDS:2 [Gigaspora margarita]|uniref:27838_t:CDS:1 n=1 Tax=Gigaspora margarita TaxID=4874 RepID=A0ABN7UNP4_GIGMA|nr:27838_t:CDS:2 [Gigaspora margarita]